MGSRAELAETGVKRASAQRAGPGARSPGVSSGARPACVWGKLEPVVGRRPRFLVGRFERGALGIESCEKVGALRCAPELPVADFCKVRFGGVAQPQGRALRRLPRAASPPASAQ